MTTTPDTITRRSTATDAGVLAERYRLAVSDCLESGEPVSHDAAAITYALLYLGAVVQASSARNTAALDALGELLADQIQHAIAGDPAEDVSEELNWRRDGIADEVGNERAAAAAGQHGRR